MAHSARLSVQSSEFDPPPSPASEGCSPPTPVGSETHSLGGKGGGAIPTKGQTLTQVLYCMYAIIPLRCIVIQKKN
jgi:hypothetical protein